VFCVFKESCAGLFPGVRVFVLGVYAVYFVFGWIVRIVCVSCRVWWLLYGSYGLVWSVVFGCLCVLYGCGILVCFVVVLFYV